MATRWKKLHVLLCKDGVPRETREGWPLLAVETEVNGDSKRTNESGSFLGRFVGLVGFVLP